MTALTRAPAAAEERTSAEVDPVVAILGLAFIGGVAVRAIPVVPADFPLNDGGLFATMIEGLARHGLWIPAFIRYNGGSIPFAYPPLALELGAVLHLMGIATTTILQWVPFILSCLTIPAAYLALRAMIGDRMHAAVATLFFALLPRSYEWLISGGGLTRSLGLLLALLALWRLATYTATGRRWVAVQGGLVAGLAATSHPEAAMLITTGALILLARQRDLRRIGWLVVAGLIATIAALPWLVSVIAQHGLLPFLAALGSRGVVYPVVLLNLLSLRFTDEVYFALGSLLGIVGLVHSLLEHRWWPSIWLVLTFLLIPGGSATYAMLPWSVLISIAVLDLIGPKLRASWRRSAIVSAAVLVFILSVWTSQLPSTILRSLSPDVRGAMVAVRSSSGDDAYLVITGSNWARDRVSEWFPFLAGRVSVTAPQGFEFRTTQEWDRLLEIDRQAQACASQGVPCLLRLESTVSFSAVFVPKGPSQDPPDDCCVSLRDDIRNSPAFVVTYDGPGATIAFLKSVN